MVQASSIVALLYLLDLCAWVIMLGGTAAWQYQCNSQTPDGGSWTDLCMTADVQLNWWALWFQFFILIFLFVVYFSRQGTSYRVSLMTLLAMVTTLLMVTTNQAFDYIKNDATTSALKSATQATAAGSIITMVANLLLIIVVGGDLSDALAKPAGPAVPLSHQGQDPAVVQMSGSFQPPYGTKPQV